MSTTLAAPASFVARAETAGAVIVRGTTLTFLVESHRTADAWSIVAYDAPPGFAAGEPHHHERTTEIFHVVEGTLTVLLGDETLDVGPGGCAVVTPGTTHTFSNRSDARVKFLALATPGGHDAFLRELLALVAVSPTWPPADPTPIRALGARYDTVYGAR